MIVDGFGGCLSDGRWRADEARGQYRHGLIKDDNRFAVLTDILVRIIWVTWTSGRGHRLSVSALQMDIKIRASPKKSCSCGSGQGSAHAHLGKMQEAMGAAKTECLTSLMRDENQPDKIRDVIPARAAP
jgi:polyribonucleotide nucleotidyltransferase